MSLKDAAIAVRENAYAPYSQFKVGAAIRTPSGAVYSGCNVENAAYPEGTCAEAGAIAAMIAAGETDLWRLMLLRVQINLCRLVVDAAKSWLNSPRGDVEITMATMTGEEQVIRMDALLPGAFDAAFLKE